MPHAVFCHFACASCLEPVQHNRRASDTGAAPGHANSAPHLPGSPVANNSCPLRPYHTEYNHIVQLEMGNLIQITEEGTKTFSPTQCCLFFFFNVCVCVCTHISNLPVGKGFKTHLGRKHRIKIAYHVSKNSNNNKKPPSASQAAPISAAAFLTIINGAHARNLKRHHDLRRKWCMLTKHDLSHMDENKRKTSLTTAQPPLLCGPEGGKEKGQNKGREAQAMEDGSRKMLLPYGILVNSSL